MDAATDAPAERTVLATEPAFDETVFRHDEMIRSELGNNPPFLLDPPPSLPPPFPLLIYPLPTTTTSSSPSHSASASSSLSSSRRRRWPSAIAAAAETAGEAQYHPMPIAPFPSPSNQISCLRRRLTSPSYFFSSSSYLVLFLRPNSSCFFSFSSSLLLFLWLSCLLFFVFFVFGFLVSFSYFSFLFRFLYFCSSLSWLLLSCAYLPLGSLACLPLKFKQTQEIPSGALPFLSGTQEDIPHILLWNLGLRCQWVRSGGEFACGVCVGDSKQDEGTCTQREYKADRSLSMLPLVVFSVKKHLAGFSSFFALEQYRNLY